MLAQTPINNSLSQSISKFVGTKDLALEAEISTLVKPQNTIKKLVNADKNNPYCVFIVEDGKTQNNNFIYWAELIDKTLSSNNITNEWLTLIISRNSKKEPMIYKNRKLKSLSL